MIDIRKLKELVRLMVANDLTELDLRDDQQQVTVKRGNDQVPVIQQAPMAMAPAAAAPVAAAPAAAPASPEPPVANEDEGLIPIESPMVGTFYAKPSPEKPSFVSVGDTVEVYLERVENALGEAVLSRDKARREESWIRLEAAFEANEKVSGQIFNQVKGGFTVDLDDAFDSHDAV